MKMVVPKAPWSAVSVSRRTATALSFGFQGGSFAAALRGASHIFVQSGEPKDHEIFARNDKRQCFAVSRKLAATTDPLPSSCGATFNASLIGTDLHDLVHRR
jgi:hypothetical protein